jgi:1,4-dihydroxy-2-naphthoyl-CoA hydrolase
MTDADTDTDTDAAFPSFDQGLADVLMSQAGLDDGLSGYLGMQMVEVRPGVAVVETEARDELVHRFGVVHGGVVASLVDQALGAAVLPVIPKGSWPATLEFKLNYLAPARAGTIRATGTVASLRRRTAVVQVEVVNDGRTVAVALGTVSISQPPG